MNAEHMHDVHTRTLSSLSRRRLSGVGSFKAVTACLRARMYPIGTEVSRITDRDMELGGYHIPAGVSVHW